MGKILLFKDADFSAVAVDHVPIGANVLTPTIINGEYAINTSGVITSATGWNVYYVPITEGNIYQLSIVWSAGHYQRVGKSDNEPTSGSTLTMLVNQQVSGQATKTLDYTYTADSDGYLVWQMHVADTVSCVIKEWSM